MGKSLGDLVGRMFGAWLVLAPAAASNGSTCWFCHCMNCGPKRGITGPSVSIVDQSNLISGASQQCRSCAHTTHGGSCTVEYAAWQAMHGRCESYPNYIKLGIQVCSRWTGENGFLNFLEDMGLRPPGVLWEWSVGRIDPWGNYEGENCRWEQIEQQAREKTTNVVLEVNGIRKIKEDWSKEMGISTGAISSRLAQGKSHEEAVLTPSKKKAPEQRTREDGQVERQCKHCGRWVLLSEGYHVNTVGHGGYASTCKACKNAEGRKQDIATRRAAGAKPQHTVPQRTVDGHDERWCGACPPNGAWRDLDEFGLKEGTRLRSICKSCHSAQRKVVCRDPHEDDAL